MSDSKKPKADTILVGGEVITMEKAVETRPLDVAIFAGRILTVAQRGGLDSLRGSDTRVIDLAGRTLLPGLIDSHNHMVRFGENLQAVDVSPPNVSTIARLLEELQNRAALTPKGGWITAWGYDDTRLDEMRHPTREELDRACPDHPVSLMRTCMHVMAVNSAALELAGLGSDTPDPLGGELGREGNGRLNGLLFELGAMNLINRLIPLPDSSQCGEAIGLASEFYARQGLTMVTEAGAGWSGNPNEAAGFQTAYTRGMLKQRVFMGLMEDTYALLPENGGTGLFTGFGNEQIRIGPAKFVADGGIGARTAALMDAYEGSAEMGVLCEDPESLTRRMETLHRADFQLSVHAIGDRTLDMVLTAYENILARHPRPHRHRVEHVAVCRPEFLPRLRKLGLIAVVQPAFIYYLGDSFIANLGSNRLRHTIPIKSLMEAGILVAGSSDRPVTEGNPWTGIWSAVNRRTVSGQSLSSEEKIPVREALLMYTNNGAYAAFEEENLGSLRPGKWADITVTDRNPLAIPPEELNLVRTVKTYLGGREVFTAV